MSETTFARDEVVRSRLEHSAMVTQRLLADGPLLAATSEAAGIVTEAALRRSTVFFFGNGGSSADAGHLAAELMGRFYRDRQPLPAVALADSTAAVTAIGNDYSYDEVFSRQIRGLGRPGDVAIGLSTSGNSMNVVRAFEAARELGLTTIAMTGESGGKMQDFADVILKVPSADTPRVQECHTLLGHIICELVELAVFPEVAS